MESGNMKVAGTTEFFPFSGLFSLECVWALAVKQRQFQDIVRRFCKNWLQTYLQHLQSLSLNPPMQYFFSHFPISAYLHGVGRSSSDKNLYRQKWCKRWPSIYEATGNFKATAWCLLSASSAVKRPFQVCKNIFFLFSSHFMLWLRSG